MRDPLRGTPRAAAARHVVAGAAAGPIAADTLFAATGAPPPGAPLAVDVGCGKGRYLTAVAAGEPGTRFIGIDRIVTRLVAADRRIGERGLTNVRLLHGDAAAILADRLPCRAVDRVTVFFPDPWPKRRHHRRRLFTPAFRDALARTLVAGGCVHVASDAADYMRGIGDGFADDGRFAAVAPWRPEQQELRTEFELIFTGLNRPIHRASWRLTSEA